MNDEKLTRTPSAGAVPQSAPPSALTAETSCEIFHACIGNGDGSGQQLLDGYDATALAAGDIASGGSQVTLRGDIWERWGEGDGERESTTLPEGALLVDARRGYRGRGADGRRWRERNALLLNEKYDLEKGKNYSETTKYGLQLGFVNVRVPLTHASREMLSRWNTLSLQIKVNSNFSMMAEQGFLGSRAGNQFGRLAYRQRGTFVASFYTQFVGINRAIQYWQ
ncbi:hypothetical protein K438DRAFT_1939099 [Mycena galopus ATCC 62051]|nr:hypothetical protein K438DRAFT_1939099 [Mycena galopus ATCC 62051]